VLDRDLYSSWCARDEAGHHDQNLQILERLLAARPDDPDLHLQLAVTLLALERYADARSAVNRAIDLGENDAAVLVRAGSLCFFNGDLSMARECIERVKRIAPRGFPLKKDLRELDRRLRRRKRGLDREKVLSSSFDDDPRDRLTAADLARHLARTGRTYAAYHVVARGLHHHPEDRSLRRLERKLRKRVPSDERTEAERWAASGEPRTLRDRSEAAAPHGENVSEADRRQGSP